MWLMVLSLVVTFGFVSQCVAEEPVNVLPEIVIGGTAPAASERCVEVEIGSSRAMNCLNQKLKKEVDRVNPSVNVPPIDAKSSDLKVGVVNVPGAQQQYGQNFGRSVIPYRPASPMFTPSTTHR